MTTGKCLEMVEDRVSDLARRTIHAALEDRWTPLSRQTLEITSNASLHGVYGGSRMLVQIIELYKAELSIQVSMAWAHLQRVLSSMGVGWSDTLAADLKALMGDTIDQIAADVLQHINNLSPFKSKRTDIIEPGKPLEEVKGHALRKVGCEIELYVARVQRAARDTQQVAVGSVNIYGGQVGILQMGDFSAASMVVALDTTSKKQIMGALEVVEKALSDIQETQLEKAEILDLVKDGKTETDKAKPNVTRLRAALLGIATSIQSVAALKPAYETLKGALALVGVTLP